MDPVTLIVVFMIAVLVFAAVTRRMDMIGAILLAAFILLLWVVFGPHPVR